MKGKWGWGRELRGEVSKARRPNDQETKDAGRPNVRSVTCHAVVASPTDHARLL